MNTKNNQRYKEMDICMKAAMLELMQQMDFEKITVKAICLRAGVNRGTFYSHYVDIPQMLDEIENHLSIELISAVKQAENSSVRNSLFLPYLTYMKQHKYFYRVVLQNLKMMPVRNSFLPLWEGYVLPQCSAAGIIDEETLSFYAAGFQAAISAILQHWIKTDCQKDELELAVILEHCIPSFISKNPPC